MSKPTPRSRPRRGGGQALRGARRPCRGCRSADRAAAEHFEPLWIGSFATRLRQVPTQLHAKLDPASVPRREGPVNHPRRLRAAYEAKSKLARDMALWHQTYDLLLAPVTPTAAPPVETLYNSDAFPRWTKRVPYTLPFNLTGQPAASMRRASPPMACRSGCRSSGRRAPIIACCRRCAPTKARSAGHGRNPKSSRASAACCRRAFSRPFFCPV